jgi:hypothetical protein
MKTLSLIALLSIAAAACGSISSTATDGGGKGGATGTGGATGAGGNQGSGGQTGGLSCAQIQTDYKLALAKARQCSAGAANQCQQMASTELGCNGCPTFVNDDSGLSAPETAWNQAKCDQNQVCTNIACVSPKGSTCRAGDGGGAICIDTLVATP